MSFKKHPIVWTIFWAVIVLAIWRDPLAAAAVTRHLFAVAGSGLTSIATFVGSIVAGGAK